MRNIRDILGRYVDGRDAVCAAGLAMLWYGGEALHAGAGYAVVGAVMIAIAVLVR